LGILAPTSEGKTYPVIESLQYFPKSKIWYIGKMSPMVLVSQKGILVDSNNEPIEEKISHLKGIINNKNSDEKVKADSNTIERHSDLNLEEMKFVPISSLFKEDRDRLLDMERPTGATYTCPNCKQDQFTGCWELHKESCTGHNFL
jgi:hypothetical protein